jgi:DNA invertase Pin-like site-specific DNA recombinase
MKIVAYIRVSTAKQGLSGLGLAAQSDAIGRYATSVGAIVAATFMEVESGKQNSRPELRKALHLAKVTGATLVIAKLDRLSRNAAFLLTLRDSGVRFIAADMPNANDLTVGIMALVAQQEREAISRRTREALAAAKARGTRLGNPKGAAALRRAGKGNAASIRAAQDRADRQALDVRPVIDDLRQAGCRTLRALATGLNERGILTPRHLRWHRSSVANVLRRVARHGNVPA